MKIHNFRGDLTDISAEKEALERTNVTTAIYLTRWRSTELCALVRSQRQFQISQVQTKHLSWYVDPQSSLLCKCDVRFWGWPNKLTDAPGYNRLFPFRIHPVTDSYKSTGPHFSRSFLMLYSGNSVVPLFSITHKFTKAGIWHMEGTLNIYVYIVRKWYARRMSSLYYYSY